MSTGTGIDYIQQLRERAEEERRKNPQQYAQHQGKWATFFDIITRDTQGSASFFDELLFDTTDRNPFEAFWQGAWHGKGTAKSFSDVLTKAGWNPESKKGRLAKTLTSFVLDVGLSPTTYLVPGASPFAKAGKVLPRAGKALSKYGSAEAVAAKFPELKKASEFLEKARRANTKLPTWKRITDVQKGEDVLNVLAKLEKGQPITLAEQARIGARNLVGLQGVLGGKVFAAPPKGVSAAVLQGGAEFFDMMGKTKFLNPMVSGFVKYADQVRGIKQKYPSLFKLMDRTRHNIAAATNQGILRMLRTMALLGNQEEARLITDILERGDVQYKWIDLTKIIDQSNAHRIIMQDAPGKNAVSSKEAARIVYEFSRTNMEAARLHGVDALFDTANLFRQKKKLEKELARQTTVPARQTVQGAIDAIDQQLALVQDPDLLARSKELNEKYLGQGHFGTAVGPYEVPVYGDVDNLLQFSTQEMESANRFDKLVRELEAKNASMLETRTALAKFAEEERTRMLPGRTPNYPVVRYKNKVIKFANRLGEMTQATRENQGLMAEARNYDLLQGIPGVGRSDLVWIDVPITTLRPNRRGWERSAGGLFPIGTKTHWQDQLGESNVHSGSPLPAFVGSRSLTQEVRTYGLPTVTSSSGNTRVLVPALVKDAIEENPELLAKYNNNPRFWLTPEGKKLHASMDELLGKAFRRGVIFSGDANLVPSGSFHNLVFTKEGKVHLVDVGDADRFLDHWNASQNLWDVPMSERRRRLADHWLEVLDSYINFTVGARNQLGVGSTGLRNKWHEMNTAAMAEDWTAFRMHHKEIDAVLKSWGLRSRYMSFDAFDDMAKKLESAPRMSDIYDPAIRKKLDAVGNRFSKKLYGKDYSSLSPARQDNVDRLVKDWEKRQNRTIFTEDVIVPRKDPDEYAKLQQLESSMSLRETTLSGELTAARALHEATASSVSNAYPWSGFSPTLPHSQQQLINSRALSWENAANNPQNYVTGFGPSGQRLNLRDLNPYGPTVDYMTVMTDPHYQQNFLFDPEEFRQSGVAEFIWKDAVQHDPTGTLQGRTLLPAFENGVPVFQALENDLSRLFGDRAAVTSHAQNLGTVRSRLASTRRHMAEMDLPSTYTEVRKNWVRAKDFFKSEKLSPMAKEALILIDTWNKELSKLLVDTGFLSNDFLEEFSKRHGINYVRHYKTMDSPMALARTFNEMVAELVNPTTFKPRKLEGAIHDILDRGGQQFFESDIGKIMAARHVEVMTAVENWKMLKGIAENPEWAKEIAPSGYKTVKGAHGANVPIPLFTPDEGYTLIDHPLFKGSGIQIKSEVAREVNKIISRYRDVRGFQKSLQYWDQMNDWWKQWVLFVAPSTIHRNLVGGIHNNFLGEVPPHVMLETQSWLVGRDIFSPAVHFLTGKRNVNLQSIGAVARGGHKKVRGLNMTRQQLLDEMNSMNIFNRGMYGIEGEIERQAVSKLVEDPNVVKSFKAMLQARGVRGKALKGLELALLGGPNPQKNWIVSFFRKQMEMAEVVMRSAAYVHSRRRGLSAEEAAAVVKELHFDYSDMKPFEKNVLRRFLFPFWSWTRNNVPLQAKFMITRPGRTRIPYLAKQEIEKEFGGPTPDERIMPEFLKDNLGMRYNYNKETGTFEYFLLRSWLPSGDVAGFLDLGDTLTSMLNPWIRAVGDIWIYNKNPAFDREVESFPGEMRDFISPEAGKEYAKIPGAKPIAESLAKLGSGVGLTVGSPLEEGVQVRGKLLQALSMFRVINELRRTGEVSARQGGKAAAVVTMLGKSFGYDPPRTKRSEVKKITNEMAEVKWAWKNALRDGKKSAAKYYMEKYKKLAKKRAEISAVPLPEEEE